MQHVCMKNNADEMLCSYERLNFFRRGAFSLNKTTTVFLAMKTPPRCTKDDQIPKNNENLVATKITACPVRRLHWAKSRGR